MPLSLLAATTAAAAAAASSQATLTHHSELPVSFSAYGVTGAEEATLQYYDGTGWRDYYADGEAMPKQITATNSMVSVYAPGQWRMNKSATAAAVAVMLHSKSYP